MSDPDWLALLTAVDGYDLAGPVPTNTLDAAEESIGLHLPPGLRALYLLTDGVLDTVGEWWVIWPINELLRRNLVDYQSEGSSRHDLVAFGDDGTGNPFCVRRDEDEAVYHWSPIDQQATWLAANMPEFWTAWLADRLPPH